MRETKWPDVHKDLAQESRVRPECRDPRLERDAVVGAQALEAVVTFAFPIGIDAVVDLWFIFQRRLSSNAAEGVEKTERRDEGAENEVLWDQAAFAYKEQDRARRKEGEALYGREARGTGETHAGLLGCILWYWKRCWGRDCGGGERGEEESQELNGLGEHLVFCAFDFAVVEFYRRRYLTKKVLCLLWKFATDERLSYSAVGKEV